MTDGYSNDDFVHVDPAKREVVGRVQWSKEGAPLMMERSGVESEEEDGKERKHGRKKRKQYYPWGTYRTMKKLFRIEGKEKEIENYRPLDDAMTLALKEPYWD